MRDQQRRQLSWWLIAPLLFGLLQCSKDTEFLHHVDPLMAPRASITHHKVRSLKGDSDIDILWVIDNSGSMGDDQAAVIANTSLFMNEFTQSTMTRWKMGLISTSDYENPYLGFNGFGLLDWTLSNPIPIFQSAVARLGTDGDITEKEYDPIVNHLRAHPDFLRPKAWLATIILTDEPEQSRLSTTVFLSEMATLHGNSKRQLFYGVLAAVEWGCSGGLYYRGSKFEELFNLVGKNGKTFSLCSPDFGINLAEIGKDIVSRLDKPRVSLESRPIVESIEVLYLGKRLPAGFPADGGVWTYDFEANAIIFYDLSFAPGDNEFVTIRYDPDAG